MNQGSIRIVNELEHRYLIRSEKEREEGEEFELIMLRELSKVFLPVQRTRVDGSSEYRYEITGKRAVSDLPEDRCFTAEELQSLLRQTIGALEEADRLLLDPNCIVFSPDQVFEEEGKLRFLYLPSRKEAWQDSLRDFLEFLTEKRAEEEEALRLSCRILQRICRKEYTLPSLRELCLSPENPPVLLLPGEEEKKKKRRSPSAFLMLVLGVLLFWGFLVFSFHHFFRGEMIPLLPGILLSGVSLALLLFSSYAGEGKKSSGGEKFSHP